MSQNDTASKGHDDHGHKHEVEVHFRHIAEAEKVNFKFPETATLEAAWEKAYELFNVARNPLDVLQTADNPPKSLMGSLSVTLKAAKDQKLVKNFHFEIAAATGGA